MNRDDLPDEEEQYASLPQARRGHGRPPVTVRTLDVGGDKLAASLAGHHGASANPALGLRAIRLSLKERTLLDAQLAAMLRAGGPRPDAHPAADDLHARRGPPGARGIQTWSRAG